MKQFILLLMLTVASIASARPTINQITAVLEKGSLQMSCSQCETNFRLYDVIRYNFYDGHLIGKADFKATATLCGQLVGIEYDGSASNNIAILNAIVEYSQPYAITAKLPVLGTTCIDQQTVEYLEVFHQPVKKDIKPIQIKTLSVDSISSNFKTKFSLSSIDYPVMQTLTDLWNLYTTSADRQEASLSHRKARYAMLMAEKYGKMNASMSYLDGFSRQRKKHCNFVQKKGEEVYFLGWNADAYKKYYSYSKRRKKNKYIAKHKLFNASVSVAKSRRACRKYSK